jgi:hypothetical protein
MARKKKKVPAGVLLKNKVHAALEQRKFDEHRATLEKECPTKWQRKAEKSAYAIGEAMSDEWVETLDRDIDRTLDKLPAIYWDGVGSLDTIDERATELVAATRKVLGAITLESPFVGSPLVGSRAWMVTIGNAVSEALNDVVDESGYRNPVTGYYIDCVRLDLIDEGEVARALARGIMDAGMAEAMGHIYYKMVGRLAHAGYITDEDEFMTMLRAGEDK